MHTVRKCVQSHLCKFPVLPRIDGLTGLAGFFKKRFPSFNHVVPVLGIRIGNLIPLFGCWRSMSKKIQCTTTPIKDFVIFQVDNCNRKRCGIKDVTQFVFTLAKFCLCLFTLGNVLYLSKKI